jgi:two-component system sensor histidine kinase TctE
MARTTDSAVHLANRLLTLARAEHGAAEGTMRSRSPMRRARSLELSQQAVSRRIGLAFEEEGTSASRPMPCCCMN